jgi:UDP-3-O-[3-hydroxymyristoyl] glucosamine N-acyltransferase
MTKPILRRAFNRVLHLIARNSPGATTLRPFLHRLRGVKIGKNVFIGDDVYLENEYPELVELLDNTTLAIRCVIIAHTRGEGRVTIGPNVLVGPGALVVCSSGKILNIGAGAVVSTGSLVTSSVAPRTLIAAPRSPAVGRITVLWNEPGSFERFIAGIRPLRPAKTEPDAEGPSSETPAGASQPPDP